MTTLGEFSGFAGTATRFTTNLNAFQTALTLVTEDLPAGDYVIGYSCVYQTTNSAGDVEIRLFDSGPATALYATERLQENNPGDAVNDSKEGFFDEGSRTLAAGVHTLQFQFQAVPGGADVTIETLTMWYYSLDDEGVPPLFYHQTEQVGIAATSSSSYQQVLITPDLENLAGFVNGTYRIGMVCQLRDENSAVDVALRLRFNIENEGPAPIILYGDDSGNTNEAIHSNDGQGDGSSDPWLPAAWITTCFDITDVGDVDSRQLELSFRNPAGGLNDIEVVQCRLYIMRLPDQGP